VSEITAQMNRLPDFIGRQVEIEYVSYGTLRCESGELRYVAPFVNIQIGSTLTPFIGYGSAIRRISLGKDVIFLNPLIPIDYDIRNDMDRYALFAAAFGDDMTRRSAEALKMPNDELMVECIRCGEQIHTPTGYFLCPACGLPGSLSFSVTWGKPIPCRNCGEDDVPLNEDGRCEECANLSSEESGEGLKRQ
jgi:predicted RNA-binding Zn-ribbon protein involved in translation (DUF1610 family)